MTALFLGFFSVAWFSWGAAGQPDWLGIATLIGAVLGIAVAAAGAVLGFRRPRAEAALADRQAGRRYGIIVGIEFALAAAGAMAWGLAGQPDFIPIWISAVVAAHFFPLAPVLRDGSLRLLGALMLLVSVAALLTAVATDAHPAMVTGPGCGALLLAFASAGLAAAFPGAEAPTAIPQVETAERAGLVRASAPPRP
jgi:hypothetical protein